ncbi:GAF domain-containing protein [Actinoplanes sp. NPDC051851]|uniref:GAF domain-containing protein n=1 Tax=Actinoplanes sp. NPDC051851 TaxID=3154753 RepID=UPI003412F035
MQVLLNPHVPATGFNRDVLRDPARLRSAAAALPGPAQRTGTPVLDGLVTQLAATLPATACAATVVLADAVLPLAVHGRPDKIMEVAEGVPCEWSPCRLVVETGLPVLISDIHNDPNHVDNDLVLRLGLRCYAGVPVRDADGLVIGSLIALDKAPYAFSLETLEELQAHLIEAQSALTAPAV